MKEPIAMAVFPISGTARREQRHLCRPIGVIPSLV